MKSCIEVYENPDNGRKKTILTLCTRFLSKYCMVRTLQSSKLSDVYLVRHKDSDELFVCKRIRKELGMVNEYRYPNSIESDKIVKILEIYYNNVRGVDYVYYIMKYYESTEDLLEYINRKCLFDEESIKKVVLCMIECIELCHRNEICHLDIKFENFVVRCSDPLDLVLIDFGSSCRVGDVLKGVRGTRNYIAPEVYRKKYSYLSDVYSLGSSIFYNLTGAKYNKDTVIDRYNLTKECVDLLKGMLRMDPEQRKSMDWVRCHGWFSSDSSDKMEKVTKQEDESLV